MNDHTSCDYCDTTGYRAAQQQTDESCGHFEETDVILGVDYRTEDEQARHPVAGEASKYDVTIKFLNGATEVVRDAVLVRRTGNIVEIVYGSDSSVTVNLANVQFVSTRAQADRVNAHEIKLCGKVGPRIGDEVVRCGLVAEHPDDVKHFDHVRGVQW